jgi:uncharacterized SAM-binding protein YcdF (DUF218 family)
MSLGPMLAVKEGVDAPSSRFLLRRFTLGLAALQVAAMAWLIADWPTGIEGWLDVTSKPRLSAAIVVLGGGATGTNLPLSHGWERLDVAAQLYADRFAPFVVVTGGGTENVSEAEIYANAAAWLGVPPTAVVLEPSAQRTAEHGHAVLGVVLPDGDRIGVDTPLIVVTSAFHSRRALMSFHRAGFRNVCVVSRYVSRRPAAGTPAALRSTAPGFAPSGRRYDDVLFRLAYRSFDFFIALREVGAIFVERSMR